MNRKTYFLFQFSRKYLMVLGILIFITDHATTDFSSEVEELIQQAAREIPWGGKQIRIGLGDFTFRDTGKTSEFSSTLKNEVKLALTKERRFRLINRLRLNQFADELKLQLSDLFNQKTAKQIGKVEGLDAMLFANFYELPGNRVKIVLSFVNVETGDEHPVPGEVERPEDIQIEPEFLPDKPEPLPPDPIEPLLPVHRRRDGDELMNYTFELVDFRTGEFIHDDWKIWVQRFAKRIRLYEKHASVRDITAKGFADGQKNEGVSDWSQVPENCRPPGINSGKLNDPDLASVRACQLREQIYQIMPIGYSSKQWKFDKPYDHRDDGQDRPELRKVEIRVKIREKN